MSLRVRDTSALAVASVATGLLAYAFFAMTTRGLGAEAASPVTVLWTYWSFAAAALTFPVQHWIARSVSAHQHENDIRSSLRHLSGIVLAAAVVFGALSWLARDALFQRDGLAFPAMVAGVTVGSAIMGVGRGTLTGRRQFGGVAYMLVADNAVRCLGAAALMLGDVKDPVAYGAVLLAGYVIVIGRPASLRVGSREGHASATSPLRFLGGASSGQLLAQLVLTGGPVLLALGGGTPVEVTAMFAGLALFRAPYTFAVGLVSQLTGLFTSFVMQGRRATVERVRNLIISLTAATVLVAAALGITVGPAAVRLVFGSEVHLESVQAMLLTIGSAVALGGLVLTVLVLALDRSAGVPRAWLTGCFVAAAFFTIADLAPLDRACWTFALAQAAAFVVLMVEEERGRSRMRVADLDGRSSITPER